MNLHPFYHFLKERSKSSMPGLKAQMKMAPVPLNSNYKYPKDDLSSAHPSSVLALLYPNEKQMLQILFTLRTDSVPHAGQISFPGGRSEPDEDLKQTALRETEEEIGISPDKIHIACSLSSFTLHKSRNKITPFVGFLLERPDLNPNPDEVQEAFQCDLNVLMDNHCLKKKKWKLSDQDFEVPYWDIHDVPLWGATAMMLNELLVLYEEFKSES